MLEGKKIITGICGGIAAYKAVEVVSRLKKLNADVDVIMTDNAARFVTPLTFRAVSRRPVVTDMFNNPENWETKHISLADKADLMIIVPATANIIGKTAGGIADDMLTTVVMAVKSPVLFVPAMNSRMYENRLLQENIKKLETHGFIFMEPEEGRLASGSYGKGRLPEPGRIVDTAVNILCREKDMKGINVMITAGPTVEHIDPVRYISNNSSGKMGYALGLEAYERGASVKIISGPVNIHGVEGIDVLNVMTGEEMYKTVLENYMEYDIIIFAAAVADYRCRTTSQNKIKKLKEEMIIDLIKNPDIAKELGKNKKNGKVHIGFAAETENLRKNALLKLESKNFDMIVANDVTMEGSGFKEDTNIVTLFGGEGEVLKLPLMSKREVAERILNEALRIYYSKIGGHN
jgi:phosphopantothenoylcysteine decarboxylase / phosphopantothenate---cysteine ligase